MSQPNYFQLPNDVNIYKAPMGGLELSPALVDLLTVHRSHYEWPKNTGAIISQKQIIDLEKLVFDLLSSLTPDNAHSIVKKVSLWGNNNQKSQNEIDRANFNERKSMEIAISNLKTFTHLKDSINKLKELPGIHLVFATKIFRFCNPSKGAALDRHSSYFFNSLDTIETNDIVDPRIKIIIFS
jgi:hypothetical protein